MIRRLVIPLIIVSFTTVAGPALAAAADQPGSSEQSVITVTPSGAGPYAGSDEQPILRALADLPAAGGTIVISPGHYDIRQTLVIRGRKNVRIRGSAGAVLRLMMNRYSYLAADVPAGTNKLPTIPQPWMKPGAKLAVNIKKTSQRTVVSVQADSIVLDRGFDIDLPQGTGLIQSGNLFHVVRCDDVVIEGLTLDGNRDAHTLGHWNHVFHCGVLVSGQYKYAQTVPTAPCRRIVVRDCTIRNFHQRGVAIYAGYDCVVENCVIENTGAESVDIDHFCLRCVVRGNTLRGSDSVGVEINDGSLTLIDDNTIADCPIGIKCWRYQPCKMPWANQRNRIVGNNIQAERYGMWFGKGTRFNAILSNVIRSKGPGVHMLGDDSLIAANQVTSERSKPVLTPGSRNRVLGQVPPEHTAGRLELLLIADPHYIHHADHVQRLEKRKSTLALELLRRVLAGQRDSVRPDAVVLLGDLVDAGRARGVAEDIKEIAAVLKATGLPVLVVRGNHDPSAKTLARIFGVDYGSHAVNGYRLITFADVYAADHTSARTDEELAMVLTEYRRHPDQPILAFQHAIAYPTMEGGYPYNYRNSKEIMKTFTQARVVACISGHFHRGTEMTMVDGVNYFTCPALCESPFHYARLSVRGRQAKVSVLALEHSTEGK